MALAARWRAVAVACHKSALTTSTVVLVLAAEGGHFQRPIQAAFDLPQVLPRPLALPMDFHIHTRRDQLRDHVSTSQSERTKVLAPTYARNA